MSSFNLAEHVFVAGEHVGHVAYRIDAVSDPLNMELMWLDNSFTSYMAVQLEVFRSDFSTFWLAAAKCAEF